MAYLQFTAPIECICGFICTIVHLILYFRLHKCILMQLLNRDRKKGSHMCSPEEIVEGPPG